MPVNAIFETFLSDEFHAGAAAVFVRLQGSELVGLVWFKQTWPVNLADEQALVTLIGVSGDMSRWVNFSVMRNKTPSRVG
ncbi:hypothetical protein M0C34_08000 [Agarivorans sp. TSD2052]|uniref:hypothetical protein n=1 Tax=Agarivorans sp. TSD2052 TaxID=2937286 RepID=UPI00200C3245|nr:hypothetical protein [Agarivorans sp. TSD2052]UPW20194.1 hypothetical protein M0C34_08000 [Agarivorans sp. TSD2052]